MGSDISIVLSGEAGQGIKTIEKLLTATLQEAGYHFFSTSEVMSRVRGGNNTTEIRIAGKEVFAFVDRIDYLIVMGKDPVYRLADRLSDETVIIGDRELVAEKYRKKYRVHHVAVNDMAKEAGSGITANSVILGIILGLLDIDVKIGKKRVADTFADKKEKVRKMNSRALAAGYEEGRKMDIRVDIQPDEAVGDRILRSGTQAIGYGALAGGCNFISSYPMSPSTGVLVFMAGQSEKFGVVVEQAEDEISAINMALGAWYAGARGMVTTSGGGFALMQEGISLAGITEVPVVIHLAQRPGPATGLPTRTEQGDLNFAVYAGHGDFPRLILSPGTFRDGILLTQKAFNLADRYRVPVIILTDQYFLDSISTMEKIDFSGFSNSYRFEETGAEHRTYKFTEDGVSRRGIPGLGKGLECVDSDEHDEEGRITEDFDTRNRMVRKRLRKYETMKSEFIEPEIFGPPEYKNLVIGWGSTCGVIREALGELEAGNTAFAYFRQVFPLPEGTGDLLRKAEKTVVVENNATGQFADLLALKTGETVDKRVLQHSGMPFSVETLKKELGDR